MGARARPRRFMRRLWLPLLIVVFLAACSSAPQKVSRRSGSSTAHAWRTRPPELPHFVDHSIGREEISIEAMALVGVPYRWGGNTPTSGFDCSGLVKYVFARAASVDLPRTTAQMSVFGQSVVPGEIAAGDLVFFDTDGRPHSHVGIYVGNLQFVNAPSTGGTVRLDSLMNPYWARHFDGIRRMAPPRHNPTAPFDTPTWQASTPEPRPAARAVAVAAAPMAPAVPASTAPLDAAPPGAATVAAAPARADAFEPPPPALTAAQVQARNADATAPAVITMTQPMTTSQRAVATRPAPPATVDQPDAIDAAADAFEPPPPVATAAVRQAAQAGAVSVARAPAEPPMQILRASTAAPAQRTPTQTNDDPIARFADSSD